jgi:exosortase/archaeosortase family protein
MVCSSRTSTTRLAVGLLGAVGVLSLLAHSPVVQGLLEPVNLLLAHIVEYLVTGAGIATTRTGNVLMHPDGFGYRIDYLCSGFQPWLLITATILVVRATWLQRIGGILGAFACVEVFNVGRLVHLYWLGVHWPDAYDTGHDVVWNVLAVITALAYIGAWLSIIDDGNGAKMGTRMRTEVVQETPLPTR